jgi:hypothetical protein
LGLSLNAACDRGGSIRVEVQDAQTGSAISGYTANECDPIVADDVAAAVRWQGRSVIESMPGTAVRLCFRLNGPVRLYGFEWEE